MAWHDNRQEHPEGCKPLIMVWMQSNRLALSFAGPPLDPPPDPPPTPWSKLSRPSGDRNTKMLSSTPDHTITMLSHIVAFPADRHGMPLFVFFLLFLIPPECQITQCASGNVGFQQSLFVVFALQTAAVSWMPARGGPNNCSVVEIEAVLLKS